MKESEAVKTLARPLIPTGRTGQDAEIIGSVAIASGGAAFVNGAALTIDSGHRSEGSPPSHQRWKKGASSVRLSILAADMRKSP